MIMVAIVAGITAKRMNEAIAKAGAIVTTAVVHLVVTDVGMDTGTTINNKKGANRLLFSVTAL